MNELTTIEFSSLSTVCGGEQPAPGPSTSRSGIFENGAGPIRRNIRARLNIKTPAVEGTGDGVYESTDDRFSFCLGNTREGSPERATCFNSPAVGTGQ